MDITQTFYDHLASHYDKLFLDWDAATREQAVILDRLFQANGFGRSACILDCACGIGTQAIGLAAIGYTVTASDFSQVPLLRPGSAQRSTMCRSLSPRPIFVPCLNASHSNLISSLPWIMRCRIC